MDHSLRQLVDEYRKYREAGRVPPVDAYVLPGGETVELCSSNGLDWTACLVRQLDGALTPLVIGDRDTLLARYRVIMKEWDPARWPPMTAVVDGATRVFTPVGMSLLLGVIEAGHTALLLGVLKRAAHMAGALALIHVSGPRVTVVHVGEPMDLRRVDVDHQLALQVGRPEVQTREAAVALLPAFARLLARSSTPNKRLGPRHRGRGAVHLFTWVLVQLARMGAEDLYGRLGDIERQITVYLPGLDLPRDTLGDVLALMIEVRTCLVVRVKLMWHIRLSGLNDPESAIHRRFCAEAPKTPVDLDAAARVWAPDAPPLRTKLIRRARGPEVLSTSLAMDTTAAAAEVPAAAAAVPAAAVVGPAPDTHALGAHPDELAAEPVERELAGRDDDPAHVEALNRIRAELAAERAQRLKAELVAIKRGMKIDALRGELAEAREAAARREALRPDPSELDRMAQAQRELAEIRQARADTDARFRELVERDRIGEALTLLIARGLGLPALDSDLMVDLLTQQRAQAHAQPASESRPAGELPIAGALSVAVAHVGNGAPVSDAPQPDQ